MGTIKYKLSDVERKIDAHRTKFAAHPLLKRLESLCTVEAFRVMAKRITFYVLCFQDMIRLTADRIDDPKLKALAKIHWMEDQGHDKWFLADLRRFGISLDVAWVFGSAQETARDISYEVMADVLRAHDDWGRIAVILSLEGAGAECFGRAIGCLERLNEHRGLKYFARRHQQVERDHKVFDRKSRRALLPPSLSPESFEYASRAVDRTFSSMTTFLNYLEDSIVAASPKPGGLPRHIRSKADSYRREEPQTRYDRAHCAVNEPSVSSPRSRPRSDGTHRGLGQDGHKPVRPPTKGKVAGRDETRKWSQR
jgi:hypothetical protein